MSLLVPSDPHLQRLPEGLADARARGEPFDRAWRRITRAIICGETRWQSDQWTTVFADRTVRRVWRDAYEGAPPSPPEGAISELRGFAADGELERLHAG
jgi:hypothetical protein